MGANAQPPKNVRSTSRKGKGKPLPSCEVSAGTPSLSAASTAKPEVSSLFCGSKQFAYDRLPPKISSIGTLSPILQGRPPSSQPAMAQSSRSSDIVSLYVMSSESLLTSRQGCSTGVRTLSAASAGKGTQADSSSKAVHDPRTPVLQPDQTSALKQDEQSRRSFSRRNQVSAQLSHSLVPQC